jgi:hypothetical protein
VRGYLTASDLQAYESSFNRDDHDDSDSQEEQEIAAKCDYERYRDLLDLDSLAVATIAAEVTPPSNGRSDQSAINHCEIQFDYSAIERGKSHVSLITKDFDLAEELDYVEPSHLNLCATIVRPKSMKMHNLIEKTARFIDRQGTQMEIMLKTKQSDNCQFDFLRYDSCLNPYYKHILNLIKSGQYVSTNDSDANCQNESMIESDGDSGDDYLHPSLISKFKTCKSNGIELPDQLKLNHENSAYSRLVKSLQPRISNDAKDKSSVICVSAVKYIKVTNDLDLDTATLADGLQAQPSRSSKVSLAVPNAEIETIIDKLAQYVSKNGDGFERNVRDRNEDRFSFLKATNEFNAFYEFRKAHYINERVRLQKEDEERKEHEAKLKAQAELKDTCSKMAIEAQRGKLAALKMQLLNKRHLTDSNEQEEEEEIAVAKAADKIEDEDDKQELDKVQKVEKQKELKRHKEKEKMKQKHQSLKDKQEERKRKAALFLSMLQNKSSTEETKEVIVADGKCDTDNLSFDAIAREEKTPAMIDFNEIPKLTTHLPFFSSDQDLLRNHQIHASKDKSKERKNYRNSQLERSRSKSPDVPRRPRPRSNSRSKDNRPSKDAVPSDSQSIKKRRSRSKSRSRSESRSERRVQRSNSRSKQADSSSRSKKSHSRKSRSRSRSRRSRSSVPTRRSRSKSRTKDSSSSHKKRRSRSRSKSRSRTRSRRSKSRL